MEQTHAFRGHYKSPSQKTEQEVLLNALDVQKKSRICSGKNSNLSNTFRSGSSSPARANKSVVFPELGGPKSNVILCETQKPC